jgi:apolipoprotein N-acyltransferase
MGAVLGSLWALAAGATAAVPARWRPWLLPAAWVACGVLQRFPPFGFPWAGPASALIDQPWAASSLPVWGASGLAWSVTSLGAGLWALARYDTRRAGVVAAVSAAAGLLICGSMPTADTPTGELLSVAAIQPGTTLEERWDPSQAREIADRVWAMTAEAAVSGAELVLWPEGAMPYSLDNDPTYRELVERFAREFGVEIVLNAIAPLPGGGAANSGYLVTADGVAEARYDKVHLVPFGEFIPAWARFAFTDSLVREVGAFTPGRQPVLLPASVPLGVAICFEVVFPGLVAAEVRSGAELLVTLTNDGWYGFSWAPRQHFAQVRVRAAETGRWYARAALTGISGFVTPRGGVSAALDVGERGVLLHNVELRQGLTPRVRWGDWWTIVCWLASAILLLAGRGGTRLTAAKHSNV